MPQFKVIICNVYDGQQNIKAATSFQYKHIRIRYLKEEATRIIRTMKVLFLCLVVVGLSSACIKPSDVCTVDCAPCPATHPLASCLGPVCKCKPTVCRVQVGFAKQLMSPNLPKTALEGPSNLGPAVCLRASPTP